MLFAGDVSMNLMGLGDPVGFENLEEGRASRRKLASLSFDAAGFGHGAPISRRCIDAFPQQTEEIACLTWLWERQSGRIFQWTTQRPI
jgi:hypothetical protein